MKVGDFVARIIVITSVLLGSMASESEGKPKVVQRECVLGEDFADVNFETIEKGYNSGIETSMSVVLPTEERFCAFWAEHMSNTMPVPDCPTVDFDKEMVIAVFRGTKYTGGYSVEVTAIKEHESQIVVRAETTDPPPDAMTTQALTQPYHIVRTKKSSKLIVFDVGSFPTICGDEEGI